MPTAPPPVIARMYTDDAVLIRTNGSYIDGDWTEAETREDVRVATAPMNNRDSRLRTYSEAGIQLNAVRRFWHTDNLDPTAGDSTGDLFEWQDERWRVRETERWGGFSETIAVRQEPQ